MNIKKKDFNITNSMELSTTQATPTVMQPLKKFPAFYGTPGEGGRGGGGIFTRVLHLSVSRARTINLDIILHLCLGLLSSGFPINNLYAFFFFLFVLHASLIPST
jgi:hypothetical protein